MSNFDFSLSLFEESFLSASELLLSTVTVSNFHSSINIHIFEKNYMYECSFWYFTQ